MGALFVLLPLALAAGDTAIVEQVIDGDSVRLRDGREVRLLGINAPELARLCHNAPSAQDCVPTAEQPLAAAARDRLARLVQHQSVSLVTEQETHDRYGRLLAHLRLPDATAVEEVLLREGLAWYVAIPPNVGWLARLQAAEADARRHGRGLWGLPQYRARPAARLGMNDTGFQRITGRINRVGQSEHAVYFDLGSRLTVVIPRADWEQRFGGDPRYWRGRSVEARGWVSARGERLRLRVRHPAMLTSARPN